MANSGTAGVSLFLSSDPLEKKKLEQKKEEVIAVSPRISAIFANWTSSHFLDALPIGSGFTIGKELLQNRHRCGLTDEDLNRKWSHPDRQLHPSIYHTKGLLEYCTRILRRTPFIFCDFHGHSRRKNVFFFGCSNQESWLEADRNIPNVGIEHQLLPHVMENCSPAFSSELCTYKVERNRESTARVTVWREFGVKRSYTMETSYCGCDQGPYKGFHLDTVHLQEIGSNFCTALTCLYDERKWRIEMLLAKQDGNRIKCKLPIKNDTSAISGLELTEDSDQSKENYSASNSD
ncbi:hypothetical protein V9T40_001454 [Parthenolecanium corni]|uniref:Peptidase M14 domain-containing protein n=1 Tax=Parthenolecanium corni TaxID=536013 RepID=A0AAN9Y550_9HEMI